MSSQPSTPKSSLLPVAGLVVLGSCLFSGCGSPSEAHASSRSGGTLPENVILISIDTLRQDHVGCYGYERDTTPSLDAFASESMLFEAAYTTMWDIWQRGESPRSFTVEPIEA